MTASAPYTSESGVSLIADRGVVLYAQSIWGNSSGYLPLTWSSLFFNPWRIILFIISIIPLVCRWYAELNRRSMSHFLQNSLNLKLVSCVPLLVIIIFGMPKRVKIFLLTNEMVCWVVIDCTTSTSTHLLKWSTALILYFVDLDTFGNGPKMSSLHWKKG